MFASHFCVCSPFHTYAGSSGPQDLQEGNTQASLAHFVPPTGPKTAQVSESTEPSTFQGVELSGSQPSRSSVPEGDELAHVPQQVNNPSMGQGPYAMQSSLASEIVLGSDTQASLARMVTPDIPTGQLLDLDTDKINKLGAPHVGSRAAGGSPSLQDLHIAVGQSATAHTTASWHDTYQDSFPPASAGQVQSNSAASGVNLDLPNAIHHLAHYRCSSGPQPSTAILLCLSTSASHIIQCLKLMAVV